MVSQGHPTQDTSKCFPCLFTSQQLVLLSGNAQPIRVEELCHHKDTNIANMMCGQLSGSRFVGLAASEWNWKQEKSNSWPLAANKSFCKSLSPAPHRYLSNFPALTTVGLVHSTQLLIVVELCIPQIVSQNSHDARDIFKIQSRQPNLLTKSVVLKR